jgi:hypothetical protein
MYQQNIFQTDHKHCPYCLKLLPREYWQRDAKAYGYELNKDMVEIAMEIWRWCYDNQRTKFLSKEVSQDHKFLTQFQKLQYFGIIEKVKKSMYWRFTLTGYWFLKGAKNLTKKVWVVKSAVIDQEQDLVGIEKVVPNWKTYVDYLQDYILVPYVEVLKILK